jgi:hypothetical protein
MPSLVAFVSLAAETCLSSRYHVTDNSDISQYHKLNGSENVGESIELKVGIMYRTVR